MAAQTGCVSIGVEMIGARWWRSLAVLLSVISRVPGMPPPLFLHADMLDCTMSQFTHIYGFDVGFPPSTLKKIFAQFQSSASSQVLVSFAPQSCFKAWARTGEDGESAEAICYENVREW